MNKDQEKFQLVLEVDNNKKALLMGRVSACKIG
jgi:hypothetical protein